MGGHYDRCFGGNLVFELVLGVLVQGVERLQGSRAWVMYRCLYVLVVDGNGVVVPYLCA